ncbi:MAG: ABC transporter ATP-binding protein [candidate division WOR-3 bacterium]
MKSNFKKALYFLGDEWKEFLLFLLALCLLFAVEAIAHPLMVKFIFDEATINKNFKVFLILVIVFLLIGIIINFTGWLLELWGKRFENKVISKVVEKMLKSYYNKDYNSILQKGEGYFVGRVYKDVTEAFIPFIKSIREMSVNLTRVISFLGVLIYISWQATLTIIGLIPFIVYFSNLLSQKIKSATMVERESESNFINVLNKSISSYKLVNIYGVLPKVLEGTIFSLLNYLNALYRNFKLITTYRTGVDLIMNISDFFSLLVGAIFVLQGKLTFGGYLAFVTAFWRAVTAVSEFFRPIGELNRSFTVINRLYEFEKEGRREFYEKGNEVVLENVYFSYDKNVLLKEFSLKIKSGEKVLIIGPNGSGKTTIANIISGLLSPQKGKVILPERISSLTLPFEFPLLKIKELPIDKDLLRDFKLDEFLENYPDELSVGQRQKLSIALALSKEADLYIFDEPLANLDKESIPLIMKKILEKTKGKTLIVIMHKGEEWYPYFDKILNIEEMKKEEVV